MTWFDIGNDSFEQMNMQAIKKWIMIVKRIIRSSKRRQRYEKQDKLTIFFTLKLSVKTNQPTRINVIVTKWILRQPPINFFPLKTLFATANKPRSQSDSYLVNGDNIALPS